MDKNEKKHVQSVQSHGFCPLNMQICDVLVAVAVVVAKAPYCPIRGPFLESPLTFSGPKKSHLRNWKPLVLESRSFNMF